MDKTKINYTLYICTDSALMTSATVEQSVEAVLRGGADVIQLREKNMCARELLAMAKRVKKICEHFGKPLIIDDRVDIALARDADGVHLGQSDMPVSDARRLLGENKIIGATAPTVELAIEAQNNGADYIGVGAMFATSTKSGTFHNTKENLAAVRSAVDIPIVIIGGIKRSNVLTFGGMGVNGAAVISDIVGDPDPESAAREMKNILKDL